MNESEKPLITAIVGTGLMAGGYDRNKFAGEEGVYSHAGAYKRNGKFHLKTVCDIDLKKASSFQRDWNADCYVGNIDDICSRFHDVISICTPDKTHFEIIKTLLESRCCRTLFVEKPLAVNLGQAREIMEKARKVRIHLVINFQRNFDNTYSELKNKLLKEPGSILAGNAYYIKGLSHVGITMIDTLASICGYPKEVLAFNRVWNREVDEYTYEFIMFYDWFNLAVKTVDSSLHRYNYHIFEIDLMFSNGRFTINDNSRNIETRGLRGYAYPGVNVLDDKNRESGTTQFALSMLKAVEYIYQITTGQLDHTVNTPEFSCNNALIIDKIVNSFDKKEKVAIRENEWM